MSDSERVPGVNELTNIVFGTSESDSDLIIKQFDDLQRQLNEALDRGEPETIEAVQLQLSVLVEAHPELKSPTGSK